MKSVGEAMAIGRNFTEALQKALSSLEKRDAMFTWRGTRRQGDAARPRRDADTTAGSRQVMDAMRAGASVGEISDATGIDPWFVDQLLLIDEVAIEVAAAGTLTPELLRLAKRHGFSDDQIAELTQSQRGRRARGTHGARRAAGLQDRRHLCGGVRGARPPTTTRRMTRRRRSGRAPSRPSSSSAAAPTGSARASSSTTPASTLRWRCPRPATRR